MFSRAKKLATEAELYDVALRALTRRPHSVHEMKKLLDRRASRELLAQVVMARLQENGLLDDSRYAKQFARQRNELIWLEHNEERRYDTTLTVLGDVAAIAAAEKRIRGICAQPDSDYPAPSGQYRPIAGRGSGTEGKR